MEQQKNKLPEQQQEKDQQPQKHASGTAANIDAIITSPTDAVRSRHSTGSSLASTGTNISYEGATAPGSGGSAGTGYASGQDATGAGITAETEQLHNNTNNKDQDMPEDQDSPFAGARPEDAKGDEPLDEDETEDETDQADETDDTIGTP